MATGGLNQSTSYYSSSSSPSSASSGSSDEEGLPVGESQYGLLQSLERRTKEGIETLNSLIEQIANRQKKLSNRRDKSKARASRIVGDTDSEIAALIKQNRHIERENEHIYQYLSSMVTSQKRTYRLIVKILAANTMRTDGEQIRTGIGKNKIPTRVQNGKSKTASKHEKLPKSAEEEHRKPNPRKEDSEPVNSISPAPISTLDEDSGAITQREITPTDGDSAPADVSKATSNSCQEEDGASQHDTTTRDLSLAIIPAAQSERSRPEADEGDMDDLVDPLASYFGGSYIDLLLGGSDNKVPVGMWVEMAEVAQEEAKESFQEIAKKPGIQTVLLLDISESTKGSWPFTKAFVTSYLNDAKSMDSSEYFAIVIFGHETRVLQHSTQDYEALQGAIDALRPGGPSPLYGGLVMAFYIARLESVKHGRLKLPVYPRIVLITDGRMSPCDVISGPDRHIPREIDGTLTHARVSHLADHIASERVKLFIIPVGDYDPLLSLFASRTNGAVLHTVEQRTQLIRSAMNYNRTAVTGQSAMSDPNVTAQDRKDIQQYLNDFEEEVENMKDDLYLPLPEDKFPVGSRVRRDPDWEDADVAEGRNEVGTVIGTRLDGYVRVQWDSGMKKRYGFGGFPGAPEDVVVVDEPRIPKDEKDFQVGCAVKRESERIPTEQDHEAGTNGVIYRTLSFGIARVRWSNGIASTCFIGFKGTHDILLTHPSVATRGDSTHPLAVTHTHTDSERVSRSPGVRNNKNRQNKDSSTAYRNGKEASSRPSNPSDPPMPSCSDVNVKTPVQEGGARGSTGRISPIRLRPQDALPVKCSRKHPEPLRDFPTVAPYSWELKLSSRWTALTPEISGAIEKAFQQKPQQTTIFHLFGQPYRSIPKEMKAMHLSSNKRTDIRRIPPP